VELRGFRELERLVKPMRNMLTKTRIEELATGTGVKTNAVMNFLGTLDPEDPKYHAVMNLKQDARSYGWNAATITAITQGIAEMYTQD